MACVARRLVVLLRHDAGPVLRVSPSRGMSGTDLFIGGRSIRATETGRSKGLEFANLSSLQAEDALQVMEGGASEARTTSGSSGTVRKLLEFRNSPSISSGAPWKRLAMAPDSLRRRTMGSLLMSNVQTRVFTSPSASRARITEGEDQHSEFLRDSGVGTGSELEESEWDEEDEAEALEGESDLETLEEGSDLETLEEGSDLEALEEETDLETLEEGSDLETLEEGSDLETLEGLEGTEQGEAREPRKSNGRVPVYSMRLEAPIDEVYALLHSRGFISAKQKRPTPNDSVLGQEDHRIVAWYRRISIGLLNYYSCCDNFLKVKAIVNYQLRWSAIHTLSKKHKSSSRQVIHKYGKNLVVTRHGKAVASFLSVEDIKKHRKGFLEIDPVPPETLIDVLYTRMKRRSRQTKSSE